LRLLCAASGGLDVAPLFVAQADSAKVSAARRIDSGFMSSLRGSRGGSGKERRRLEHRHRKAATLVRDAALEHEIEQQHVVVAQPAQRLDGRLGEQPAPGEFARRDQRQDAGQRIVRAVQQPIVPVLPLEDRASTSSV
jgi:hypothetical protein